MCRVRVDLGHTNTSVHEHVALCFDVLCECEAHQCISLSTCHSLFKHALWVWGAPVYLQKLVAHCLNMLCWAGLAHIDATVRALVEIINAFCLCDSQCVTMATKHLVHLLLSPVCQFDTITANMRKKERKNFL